MAPFETMQSNDFPVYYDCAKRFCAGNGADVYALHLEQGKIGAGLNEPPFLLWVVAPLGLLPYAAAKFCFDGVMSILVASSAIILAKSAKLTNRQTLVLIGLIAATGPAFEILRVSKPGAVLFLGIACCIACLQKGQEFKAGAWAALCLIKPQEILPFFIFALGAMRIRFVLGCAAVVLLMSAVTFPLFGVQGYTNYLTRLGYLSTHPELAGTDAMPILVGQLLRMSIMPQATAIKLCNGIYAVLLLGLFIFGRRQRQVRQWWLKGNLVGIVSMACLLPYIYTYDLVILIPGICSLLQILAQQKRKLLFACVVVSIITFLDPIYAFIHYYQPFTIDLNFCALVILTVVSILAATKIKEEMIEKAV